MTERQLRKLNEAKDEFLLKLRKMGKDENFISTFDSTASNILIDASNDNKETVLAFKLFCDDVLKLSKK